MPQEGIVHIRKGREKPIHNQHPWVFSGSIYKTEDAVPGDIVTLLDHNDNFLARGYWNPNSAIQVRILSWRDEPIDEAWWDAKLRQAIAARGYIDIDHDEMPYGYRMINAENDFLPGLVVDYYAGWAVLQALTLGIDRRKEAIANALADILRELQIPLEGIYERSDVDVREREGLKQETGLLWGDEQPPEQIMIADVGNFYVDIVNGHKTGFYLDQRRNRYLLYEHIQERAAVAPYRVLNAFCYTGGFGISAWITDAADVQVVNVDSSQDALDMAKANAELNEVDFSAAVDEGAFVQADVFEYLRDAHERDDEFDMVILDPPKFAYHKGQVQSAARGYKDINLNAFKLVKPGGYLMTFSCSGAVDRDLFQKIVFGALADSGRTAQIIQHLGAADDHPVALTFPEGEYLKGLLLRVY